MKLLFASLLILTAFHQSVSGSDAMAKLIGDAIALIAGQKVAADRELPKEYAEYAMSDNSNEGLHHATPQDMIKRAGFKYENHYTITDDGYITQMVRIVNPLADRAKLKQPPVMLLQGGITDITIWLWGSISQHHPEKYPRVAKDGPITSWNRSLAFTLANNGYDVWLVSHRGANEQNQGHCDLKRKTEMPGREMQEMALNESFVSKSIEKRKNRDLGDIVSFWDYTFDEIAEFEVTAHIDKVLEETGASNVTFFPMSFSTIYGLMALARHPEYKHKIHNTVIFGPIINNKGTNRLMDLIHNTVCKYLTDELGTMLFTEILFSQAMRDLIIFLGARKDLRYALVSNLILVLAGPSVRYQTLVEPAVYGHILMPTGFKMIKHYCQVVTAAKMRFFDHGSEKNLKLYGSTTPPDYNMENVDFGNWLLVSGDNDVLATPRSVKKYLRVVGTKPFRHIRIPSYNHLDLWAAIDNDVLINLPVLKFLNRFQLAPSRSRNESFDLGGIKHKFQSIDRRPFDVSSNLK